MLLNFKKIEKAHIVFFCNLLIATFFVTVLSFKKGYSYIPMALGIIATLTFLFYRFKLKVKWQLDKEDKYFIFSLIAYFLTFVMSAIFNGDGFREIDNPSRILLLIPLIFFFNLYPIKKTTIFHFIPIGAFMVGGLAIYQKFVMKLPKPFPETMHIQAGNISILLGLLSIAIAFYWFSEKKNKIGILYIVFAAFGLLASILTGARGGWIAFPACFLLIFFFNFKVINKKIIYFSTLLLAVSLSLFIYKPEFGIQKRYKEAERDVIHYIEKGNKNTSLGARFDMWENALIAISEKPLLGHGSRGYEKFKKKQVESNQMAKTTLGYNSLHNQYLESFVKRGILGFIALLAILITPFLIFIKRLKTNDTAIKCIAILGIIHIISHSFFFLSQSSLAHNSGSLFYFFVLVVVYYLIKKKE
ncbi:O-antigen ligase [Mannheimia sp. AT1]|uniref:O-antigen ligase n=1 Tax=Mannheimia cairinae TaxID=3025936 RepID=A0ABT5MP96_9PAST|nr:O-antigen ligase [Mannheimia cairinae]MDD0823421.1 O-antigen ligase [Mannheimia cairinae]MDD0826971.1 O-antigen ligase [Mannheimia cairinae]